MAARRRARAERRAIERALAAEGALRERLARLEPGGDGTRPIEVTSASVIEPRALAHRCVACGGELRLVEHRARSELREVELSCRGCGRARVLFFRIVRPS